MLAIDGALKSLAQMDPRKAKLVELQFFGGLAMEEIAELFGGGGGDIAARLAAGAVLHDAGNCGIIRRGSVAKSCYITGLWRDPASV